MIPFNPVLGWIPLDDPTVEFHFFGFLPKGTVASDFEAVLEVEGLSGASRAPLSAKGGVKLAVPNTGCPTQGVVAVSIEKKASGERVFDFLDSPEMVKEAAATYEELVPESERHGTIVFDHVRFSYEEGKPVIRDLSLRVERGQSVAIVGPTGAGKTTLVNLLMRFYEIDSGHIYLDGVDIRDISKASLRSRMGMVLQDTWLFEGTIWDNLAFGREGGAKKTEIVQAAYVTGADRLIRQLPEGYDTVLNEDGGGISAGEKQLLTITRAYLSNSDILILDEATSSVDTRTEMLVQHALGSLAKDRTSFIIAHRLSTIRDADLIIVMEQGDVVETGNHEELLKAGGAYARLYNSQFTSAL